MKIPEITLKLETKIVNGKSIKLPFTKKKLDKRIPRKSKKKLKKCLGEYGYFHWLATCFSDKDVEFVAVFNFDIGEELEKMLVDELKLRYNL